MDKTATVNLLLDENFGIIKSLIVTEKEKFKSDKKVDTAILHISSRFFYDDEIVEEHYYTDVWKMLCDIIDKYPEAVFFMNQECDNSIELGFHVGEAKASCGDWMRNVDIIINFIPAD